MQISAQVRCGGGASEVVVKTGETAHALALAPKADGRGLATNGGELLFAAAAVCYCNDIHREAAKRGLVIESVDVSVAGTFTAAGEAASEVTYSVRLKGSGSPTDLRALAEATDRVAEVHRSLRLPVAITLTKIDVIS